MDENKQDIAKIKLFKDAENENLIVYPITAAEAVYIKEKTDSKDTVPKRETLSTRISGIEKTLNNLATDQTVSEIQTTIGQKSDTTEQDTIYGNLARIDDTLATHSEQITANKTKISEVEKTVQSNSAVIGTSEDSNSEASLWGNINKINSTLGVSGSPESTSIQGKLDKIEEIIGCPPSDSNLTGAGYGKDIAELRSKVDKHRQQLGDWSSDNLTIEARLSSLTSAVNKEKYTVVIDGTPLPSSLDNGKFLIVREK